MIFIIFLRRYPFSFSIAAYYSWCRVENDLDLACPYSEYLAIGGKRLEAFPRIFFSLSLCIATCRRRSRMTMGFSCIYRASTLILLIKLKDMFTYLRLLKPFSQQCHKSLWSCNDPSRTLDFYIRRRLYWSMERAVYV